ncbi:MAG: N-6 DNA methylase [Oscillospiraceae bacterium]|nr:N-6 DNA methylase [Oscillospiraceae bacterium]
MKEMTEDQVRDYANEILKFSDTDTVRAGVGQNTSFNSLGFKGVADRPDGWYLPNNTTFPAIILETKSTKVEIKEKQADELLKNCSIAHTKYKDVMGILYNGAEIRAFKNNEEIAVQTTLQNKEYYLSFFTDNRIDKQLIYNLTKRINDCLHFDFGIKNLYHRMVFTACALVAKRYGAVLTKGMNYQTFHASIHSTLEKSFQNLPSQINKLNILLEVFSEIKKNSTENQNAINCFIDWVGEISDCINSDYWNGEDVMAIFFNEFTRYKGKAEKGQVFTPDHITSFMYRLIDIDKDDRILDAACGSGAFLVKAMCNMIKEAGGISTNKAKAIQDCQLFGIEFDREIFALACANMLIHKDGKTNLEQLDSRTTEACAWIRSKSFIGNADGSTTLKVNHITKVMMNPPFENKYGCLNIVENVLDNVKKDILCAFILPDNKLEKNKSKAKTITSKHRIIKIIKLPENVFSGVTASIFIFRSGIPQNDKQIFACYMEDDGFETVKNQGRHDVKGKWQDIEDKWIDIVYQQNGSNTIQWLDPKNSLSYVLKKDEYTVCIDDFKKTVFDYVLFLKGIDAQEFKDKLVSEMLYSTKREYTQVEAEIRTRIDELRREENGVPSDVDTSNWQAFSIKNWLCPKPQKRAFAKYDDGDTPFVASGNRNNGVLGYVSPRDGDILDAGNCITVSAVDGSTFYQKTDFLGRGGGGSSITIVRHENMNEISGLFLATVIGKVCSKYRFTDMCSKTALGNEIVYLPNANGKPDWEYMEEFIRTIPLSDILQ